MATRCSTGIWYPTRLGYTLSGTDVRYPMPCPVLSYAMSNTRIWYPIRPGYALSGTDVGYAATRRSPRKSEHAPAQEQLPVCCPIYPTGSLCI
eukprot:441495-Rhodomonas_salina.6